MAKKNISLVEQGAGYFMGTVTGLMDAVREKGVPFEAVYRLVTPTGRVTLGKMAEIAHADWLSEQPRPVEPKGGSPYRDAPPNGNALPADRYRMHVTYAPLPRMSELEKRYSGKDSVSALFDGRAWKRHASCAEIDQTPSEREFWVAEVPHQFLGKAIHDCLDDIAAHFDALGYRFSIETEAVEFADANPELQRKNWIYALGSSALNDDGNQYVALLSAVGRGRILHVHWVALELYGRGRLLLVRK